MEMPTYLTTKEVAKMIDRAEQTLANDRHKCQGLPYIKIGRSIRYLLTDVNDFMDMHRIIPANEKFDQ